MRPRVSWPHCACRPHLAAVPTGAVEPRALVPPQPTRDVTMHVFGYVTRQLGVTQAARSVPIA